MHDSDFTVAAQEKAARIAERLKQNQTDLIVFAESCTAGLVVALLGQIPGISNWLCGSAVTYRESAKKQWLDVSAETLAQHTAESLETTCEMAVGILSKTSEASYSAAVTGHLGPDAPQAIDGKIFVAVARRVDDSIEITSSQSFPLTSSSRIDRQHEAAQIVFDALLVQLRLAR